MPSAFPRSIPSSHPIRSWHARRRAGQFAPVGVKSRIDTIDDKPTHGTSTRVQVPATKQHVVVIRNDHDAANLSTWKPLGDRRQGLPLSASEVDSLPDPGPYTRIGCSSPVPIKFSRRARFWHGRNAVPAPTDLVPRPVLEHVGVVRRRRCKGHPCPSLLEVCRGGEEDGLTAIVLLS